MHYNSGILNKAFYEAAIQIGSDKAGKIWIQSLGKFDKDTTFSDVAKLIHQTAIELYGKNSVEAGAVQEAWQIVGIPAEK